LPSPHPHLALRVSIRHSSVLGLFGLVLEHILLETRCTDTIVCVIFSCTKRRSESSRLTHKHKACFVRVSVLCKRHTPKCMLDAAVCASPWSIVRVTSTFSQMLTDNYSDVEYILFLFLFRVVFSRVVFSRLIL